MTDVVTAIAWLVGSAFALLAAVGVLRMPDVFTRMQASTKASTLGLGCLLIGAAVQMGDFGTLIRVASIGAFVLLTTPVAGHVIARASYFADVPLWKGTVLDERRRESEGGTVAGDDSMAVRRVRATHASVAYGVCARRPVCPDLRWIVSADRADRARQDAPRRVRFG